MSTRYVYGIYNTTADKRLTTELKLPVSDEMYPDFVAYGCMRGIYSSKIGEDRLGNPVVHYSPTRYGTGASTAIHDSRGSSLKVTEYPYITISRTAPNPINYNSKYVLESYLLEPSNLSGSLWKFTKNDENWIFFNNNYSGASSGASPSDRLEFYITGGKLEQGSSLLKTVSSRTRLETGAFDDDGVYKWRTLKGSDFIDPIAVTYSKDEIYAGDTVEIQVNAQTPTYGGTIYYQYEYSFDGETWVNLGSKTTSTTASVPIPEGIETFQARVIASDGWGFTSTTYIYGSPLAVSQLKAYATVNGVTRKLTKGWCIIDGVSRRLSKGYVTVDGIWKKLF